MSLEEINENKLERTRKEIGKIGLVLHFTGEFALLGTLIGCAYSLITKDNSFQEFLAETGTKFATGMFLYALPQAIALHLMGLSRTPEQNRAFAEENRREGERLKQKNLPISSWFSKKFAELADHYDKNYGNYEMSLIKYMNWRNS